MHHLLRELLWHVVVELAPAALFIVQWYLEVGYPLGVGVVAGGQEALAADFDRILESVTAGGEGVPQRVVPLLLLVLWETVEAVCACT